MEPLAVTIFHTNDMHAHLGAMSKLSHYARRLRQQATAAGGMVFMWDAGDAADRRESVVSLTKGASFYQVLKAMGYTLQTMGNDLSLTYGPQVLGPASQAGGFPVLAANCRDGSGPLPEGLMERLIIPLRSGINLGVFGLTAPWNGMYSIFGLNFPDFIEEARRQYTALIAGGAHLVVHLSHLGYIEDCQTAEALPELAVIIGGHSHSDLPAGEWVNGVLITQAGGNAEKLGRVDLELDPSSGRLRAARAVTLRIPDDEPRDPIFERALLAIQEEAERLMETPVGELRVPLALDHFDECPAGNFGADALREYMQAEAAILAAGLFHRGLPGGTVTRGALDAACFSTANPTWTMVSGAQLREALERGLDPEISHFEHGGFRGTPIGLPQISGLQVWYDPGAEVGSRVKQVLINGSELQIDQAYKLAHTDAETIPQYSYLVLTGDEDQYVEVPTIIPEVLHTYLTRHRPLDPPSGGRWLKLTG